MQERMNLNTKIHKNSSSAFFALLFPEFQVSCKIQNSVDDG